MIYVINGPNLNLLGSREPSVYGNESMEQVLSKLRSAASSFNEEIMDYQSNHEGELIDYLQGLPRGSKVIFNPGAYAHTSIALRDCIAGMDLDVIEVHISNIFAREEFRQKSFISPVCRGIISGLGKDVYRLALLAFINL